jgi:hypothetical protein
MLTAGRPTNGRAKPTAHGQPNGDGVYVHDSNDAGPRPGGEEQESLLAEQRGLGNNLRGKSRVSMAWKATGCDSVNATISMCTDFLVGTTSTVCFDIGCRWKGMAYAYALTSGL